MSERPSDVVFSAKISGDGKVIKKGFLPLSDFRLPTGAVDYCHSVFGGTLGLSGGKFYHIVPHMKRLVQHGINAGLLRSELFPKNPHMPFAPEELAEFAGTVRTINQTNYGKDFKYLRSRIFRNDHALGVKSGGHEFTVMLQAVPLENYYGTEEAGSLIIVPPSIAQRPCFKEQHIMAKGASSTYGNGAKVKQFAEQNLKTDGLAQYFNVDRKAYCLSDTSASNFFMIKGGKLYTPKSKGRFLFGITAQIVVQLAKKLKMEVVFADLTHEDLKGSEGWFVTGTAAGLVKMGAIQTEKGILEAKSFSSFEKVLNTFEETKITGEQFAIERWF